MLRALWIIHRTTYIEAARHPAYYLLLLAAALLIFVSQQFTFFGFYSEANMIREMGITSVVLWGVLSAMLLSHHLLHTEIENRSATSVLAKPVPRAAYLFGKYLGLVRALLMGGLFLTAVVILTLWTYEGMPKLMRSQARGAAALVHVAADSPAWSAAEDPVGALGGASAAAALPLVAMSPGDVVWKFFRDEFVRHDVWPMLAAGVLALGHTLLMAGFALALAAYFPPVVVANGTVAVYLVGHLTDYVAGALSHAGGALAAAGGALRWLLPNLEHFNPADHVARGEALSAIYIALVLSYAIVYAFAVLATVAFAFSRRELP